MSAEELRKLVKEACQELGCSPEQMLGNIAWLREEVDELGTQVDNLREELEKYQEEDEDAEPDLTLPRPVRAEG